MKKRKRKYRLIVQLEGELREKLHEYHVKSGVPISEMVRRGLMLYLKTQQ